MISQVMYVKFLRPDLVNRTFVEDPPIIVFTYVCIEYHTMYVYTKSWP